MAAGETLIVAGVVGAFGIAWMLGRFAPRPCIAIMPTLWASVVVWLIAAGQVATVRDALFALAGGHLLLIVGSAGRSARRRRSAPDR